MTHLTLTVKEDQETGVIGLMLNDVPFFSYPMVATSGALIAHDILEHQNGLKKIGSVGDELEALGGIWFVRGQHGELHRNIRSIHTPQDDLASDVANLYEIWSNGVPLRVEVKETRATDQDADLKDIIKIAGENMDVENRDSWKEFAQITLHLLRTGYNKAQARFKRNFKNCHRPDYQANTLFWEIAAAVDECFKYDELYEGQEYRLSYAGTEATCTLIEEYEDY